MWRRAGKDQRRWRSAVTRSTTGSTATTLQFVEVELDPGETVIGEAGAMMFLESGITFETKMGDGAEPEKGLFGKLKDAGKRALAGESLFITHFTNTGRGKQLVAFSAEFPGKIVPIDLDDLGGEIIAQKDAFLCAALGTKIDIAFRRNLGVGLFGGEGFILQRLQGDGMAFLSVGGTVVEKRLEGDKLLVDTGCLVAMEPGHRLPDRAGRQPQVAVLRR